MMCNSFIFSKNKIEDMNEFIRENIDPRLFLFAYYNPKAKGEVKEVELNFWRGITNMYGLFQDCAAYIKGGEKDLLCILLTYKIISKQNEKDLRCFIDKVNAFRTVFSHNIYAGYSKDARNIRLCQDFFGHALDEEIILNDISDLNLKENQWEIALNFLINESEKCIDILLEALKQISTDPQKSAIIEKWIELIMDWYKRKIDDLLYKAIDNQFRFYCVLHMKYESINDRYHPIKEWLDIEKSNILEKVNDINSSNNVKSMLPLEFFNALIEETNPCDFWDNRYHRKWETKS